MANQGACVLRGAAAALLRLSRACCAAPVRVRRARARYTVRLSRQYALVSRIAALLYGCPIFATLVYDVYLNMSEKWADLSTSKSDQAGFMINQLIGLLALLKVILAMWCGTERITRFLSYFKEVQRIYIGIGTNPDFEKQERVLTIILWGTTTLVLIAVMAMGTIIVQGAVSAFYSAMILLFMTTYVIDKIIAGVLVLQTAFIVVSALWSLETLNKCIKKIQDRISEGSKDEKTAVVETIRQFSRSYASIYDLCCRINGSEGFIMLMLLFDHTVRILAAAYYAKLSSFCTDCGQWTTLRMALQTLLVLSMMFQIGLIVELCHRTHVELKQTQILISELLCCPPSALDEVSVALVRFYEVTENCCQVYTPMGTLQFSRSLYSAIIGGLSTLTVLVLQF